MEHVRAHDTFRLEAHPLGHALGREVLGFCEQLEPAEIELLEAEPADETKRARSEPLAPPLPRTPVADAPGPRCDDAHPDRADDDSLEGDREGMLGYRAQLAPDEGPSVVLG